MESRDGERAVQLHPTDSARRQCLAELRKKIKEMFPFPPVVCLESVCAVYCEVSSNQVEPLHAYTEYEKTKQLRNSQISKGTCF